MFDPISLVLFDDLHPGLFRDGELLMRLIFDEFGKSLVFHPGGIDEQVREGLREERFLAGVRVDAQATGESSETRV